LVNATLKVSGEAHVKCSGSAGKNVNPEFVVEAVAHRPRRIALRHLEENALYQHGRVDLVGISPLLVSRKAPSSSVEMTGIRLRSNNIAASLTPPRPKQPAVRGQVPAGIPPRQSMQITHPIFSKQVVERHGLSTSTILKGPLQERRQTE